jgi:hypothetical protein
MLLCFHGCLTREFHLYLLLLDVLQMLDLLLLVHLPLPTVEFRGVTHVHLEVLENLGILGFLDFEQVAFTEDGS